MVEEVKKFMPYGRGNIYKTVDTLPTAYKDIERKIYVLPVAEMSGTTVIHRAGNYWYDFENEVWKYIGEVINDGTTLPSGEYVGQYFYLLEDVVEATKTTFKGLYIYNGSSWEHKLLETRILESASNQTLKGVDVPTLTTAQITEAVRAREKNIPIIIKNAASNNRPIVKAIYDGTLVCDYHTKDANNNPVDLILTYAANGTCTAERVLTSEPIYVDAVDLNTLADDGTYYCNNCTNTPETAYKTGILVIAKDNLTTHAIITQKWYVHTTDEYNENREYLRYKIGTTWGDWEQTNAVINNNNYILSNATRQGIFDDIDEVQTKIYATVKFTAAESPTGVATDSFEVTVSKNTDETYGYLLAKMQGSGAMYICTLDNSTLTDWQAVDTHSGFFDSVKKHYCVVGAGNTTSNKWFKILSGTLPASTRVEMTITLNFLNSLYRLGGGETANYDVSGAKVVIQLDRESNNAWNYFTADLVQNGSSMVKDKAKIKVTYNANSFEVYMFLASPYSNCAMEVCYNTQTYNNVYSTTLNAIPLTIEKINKTGLASVTSLGTDIDIDLAKELHAIVDSTARTNLTRAGLLTEARNLNNGAGCLHLEGSFATDDRPFGYTGNFDIFVQTYPSSAGFGTITASRHGSEHPSALFITHCQNNAWSDWELVQTAQGGMPYAVSRYYVPVGTYNGTQNKYFKIAEGTVTSTAYTEGTILIKFLTTIYEGAPDNYSPIGAEVLLSMDRFNNQYRYFRLTTIKTGIVQQKGQVKVKVVYNDSKFEVYVFFARGYTGAVVELTALNKYFLNPFGVDAPKPFTLTVPNSAMTASTPPSLGNEIEADLADDYNALTRAYSDLPTADKTIHGAIKELADNYSGGQLFLFEYNNGTAETYKLIKE